VFSLEIWIVFSGGGCTEVVEDAFVSETFSVRLNEEEEEDLTMDVT
jgi:hypothetical protein